MFPSKKGTVTFMKSQTIKTLGGVMSAEDVIELMLAGATAVEVGAANLVDPFACRRIVEDLPPLMALNKKECFRNVVQRLTGISILINLRTGTMHDYHSLPIIY